MFIDLRAPYSPCYIWSRKSSSHLTKLMLCLKVRDKSLLCFAPTIWYNLLGYCRVIAFNGIIGCDSLQRVPQRKMKRVIYVALRTKSTRACVTIQVTTAIIHHLQADLTWSHTISPDNQRSRTKDTWLYNGRETVRISHYFHCLLTVFWLGFLLDSNRYPPDVNLV
jgi:hypothetical protein